MSAPQETGLRTVTDRHGVEWSFGIPGMEHSGNPLLMARRPGGEWKNDYARDYPSITWEIAADLAPLFTPARRCGWCDTDTHTIAACESFAVFNADVAAMRVEAET